MVKARKKVKKTAKKAAKPRGPKGSGSRPRKKRASGKGRLKKVTYKEAVKRLKRKRAKPKKTRRKAKPKKRIVKKKATKKTVKRKKPKKKIVKRKPRKKVVKKKPVKRPVKRKKVIKKAKPKRRVRAKKKIVKKTRRKPKVVRRARKPVKKAKPRKSRLRSGSRQRSGKKPAKPRIYIGKGTLDQLFESQAKVKLLRLFFRNAEQMFQPKEIFKRLRSNIALLRQEMKKLEKIGLIRQKKAWLSFEKKRGGIRKERKTVWYLNPNFDFLNELRDLVLKSTIASKDELVEKARRIGAIKLLVLTGVFTGDDTARADLLIVGDKINQRKLSSFIKDLEAEVGREINCAVMTSKEFDYRYDMYDRFVRDLLDGKSEILLKRVELW